VVSMGLLRFFKKHNILENNIVQTAASAGESLAAGVIFTLPALVILGYWDDFGGRNFWWITIIAAFGGLLGVLFTIPLRRSLIVEGELQFPEGIATAEVLETGEEGGKGIKVIGQANAFLRRVKPEPGTVERRLYRRAEYRRADILGRGGKLVPGHSGHFHCK